MDERTALAKTLLGCLVGLARASDNNPKTPNTDQILRDGLLATTPGICTQEELQSWIESVKAEKDAVAPGCALCQNRCGNTDDYDMRRLELAEPEIRNAKWAILLTARALAIYDAPEAVNYLYKALYVLAEDWSAEELFGVLQEAGAAASTL